MSPQDLKHFILIYSIPDRSVEVRAFGSDEAAAAAEYQHLEAEQRDNPDVDIVLLGAESEEVIRQTHASYFADRAQHLDDLVERELAAAPAKPPPPTANRPMRCSLAVEARTPL